MRAVILRKAEGSFSTAIEEVRPASRNGEECVLEVAYSSLNYKDALALTNKSPVVRSWPMVPGIDGAGRIRNGATEALSVVTGWGLGETSWGCLAEEVSLDPDWPIALPAGISDRDAMAVGTAGLTAMLAVMAIERLGAEPSGGPVLVTGASGGVGGISLILLKKLGYHAVASTGRTREADYLRSLGAAEIIDRRELSGPGKPLQKERWAAAIDSVGSATLANVAASMRYGGVIAACGLAQGMDFPTTVAPFILRGVTLAGIDSVMASRDLRERAWSRIAEIVDRDSLSRMTREITLPEVFDAAEELLGGRIRGRLVVRI